MFLNINTTGNFSYIIISYYHFMLKLISCTFTCKQNYQNWTGPRIDEGPGSSDLTRSDPVQYVVYCLKVKNIENTKLQIT